MNFLKHRLRQEGKLHGRSLFLSAEPAPGARDPALRWPCKDTIITLADTQGTLGSRAPVSRRLQSENSECKEIKESTE